MTRRRSRIGAVTRARRGVVLLTMLWVIVAISAVAMAATLLARDAVGSSANRGSLARARWMAEGCIARVRSVVAENRGQQGGVALAEGRWVDLDAVIAATPMANDGACEIRVRGAGDAIDVNTVGGSQLRALFRAVGVDSAASDSLADAVLDWRDEDDVARPRGAEHEWYAARGRSLPRNGPFAAAEEIRRVRGFERVLAVWPRFDALLDVEQGRVTLFRSPLPVLASLPGMSAEALAFIDRARGSQGATLDIMEVAAALSPAGRDSLLAHLPRLREQLARSPDVWVVEATATDGGVAATVSVHLVRDGIGTRVISRKGQW
jgi:general secretion pathway protein K